MGFEDAFKPLHEHSHEEPKRHGGAELIRSGTTHAAKKYEVTPADEKLAAGNDTRRQRIQPKTILHLLHRLSIFGCALLYIAFSFSASYTAVRLLRGHNNSWNDYEDDVMPWIGSHLGSGPIRDSPLVTKSLGNSSELLNSSIFLESSDEIGFTRCTNIAEAQNAVFEDDFMRDLYNAIANDTSYAISEFNAMELIAPVVDCGTSTLEGEDITSGKFFYLLRNQSDYNQMSILVIYLSNQQYLVPALNQRGAAAVASMQFISDMRATDLYLKTKLIASLGYPFEKFAFRVFTFLDTNEAGLVTVRLAPRPGTKEMPKVIQTACREGFYIKAETEQSNINNYRWVIESDAVHAVGRWRWQSKSVLHDSWAWVHGVQFFIGLGLLSNLTILCLATYRNVRGGGHWIGDAFVSVSSSQLINGVAVLISWYVNEFWALHEFSFSLAFNVSGFQSVVAYDAHMHADLMTLYFSACGLIGRLFRERVDPLFAVICFTIGYEFRIQILQNFNSAIRDSVIAYSDYAYEQNVSPKVPGQDKISPMSFWTTHPIGKRNYAFVARCLSPIYASLIGIVIYVIVRKIYRHYYPETVHVLRNTTATATSENEKSLIAQKRVLTLFEVATGAKLENRYGLVSDYETCVFIRGNKFASPDGIYSTGFLIANKKFLIQTADFWSIVLMKILRRRFRNIYVYDVDGTSVKETARLVYPHTLSYADLLNINVSILS